MDTIRFTPRSARVLWLLLSALPPLVLAVLILKYKVDIPVLDQWELVPKLEKSYCGNLSLTDLWQQHNEHRPLFPLLIMVGLARLTHWNTNWELVIIFLLAVGTFAILFHQIRLTEINIVGYDSSQLWPLVSLLVFSPCQMENWLWGWQIQLLLNVFAVVAGIMLLANPGWSWSRFAAAALLGIIATYSFANGVLYWIIGFVIIAVTLPAKERKTRWLALGSWGVVAGVTIESYVYKFERFEGYGPLNLALKYPVEYLKYVSAYLGATCTGLVDQNPEITGLIPGQTEILPVSAVGALGILVWLAALLAIIRLRNVNLQMVLPYIALSTYSVTSGMLTGVARLGFGVNQALSSRYVGFSSLFWVSLFVFLHLLSAHSLPAYDGKLKTRKVWPHLLAKLFILAIATLVILNARHGLKFAKGRYESYTEAVRMIHAIDQGDPYATSITDQVYAMVYPEPYIVEERLEVLRKYRLSLFRDLP